MCTTILCLRVWTFSKPGRFDRASFSVRQRAESFAECMGTAQNICYIDHMSIAHISESTGFRTRADWYFFRMYKASRYSDWPRAGLVRSWCSSPGRVNNFQFSMSFISALGPTQPPIQCVSGARSPEVKREYHEADHSTPTSADEKKTWIDTSIPPYVFMV
jgi:hypothetical protein